MLFFTSGRACKHSFLKVWQTTPPHLVELKPQLTSFRTTYLSWSQNLDRMIPAYTGLGATKVEKPRSRKRASKERCLRGRAV